MRAVSDLGAVSVCKFFASTARVSPILSIA